MIEHFADKIDAELKCESGRVFYSGRAAFSSPADLYLLGYNPGGDPADPRTHGKQLARIRMRS